MQRLKRKNRLHIMPFFLVFCLLYLISFCLISVSAIAQDEESFISSSEFKQGYDPDSASYSAVAEAVYWEHAASMALSSGDQGKALESYKESLKLINEAIQLDPRSSFLQSKLSELSITTEDYDTAISAANSAVELDPSNADAYYFSGYLKIRKSQDKVGALADFKKAAELDPDHLNANRYLGILAFESGNYKLASSAYARIVKLRPYDPELRYRLALSYSLSGEVSKAIDGYKATIMLNESHIKAHYDLANLYARLGRNREAIDETLIVLTLSRTQNDPNVMLFLAQLYIALGDYDKGIAIGDSVLRRNGTKKAISAEALYLLGISFKEKGEKKFADENLQKSIDIYKNLLEEDATKNVRLNYDIAKVYDAKGEQNFAKKHLEKFIYLKSDDSEVSNAYNYLGYIMVEQNKNLDIAVTYIEKAIAMEPGNGVFRDSLGWAYFKLGKIDEAVVELEKAVELTPNDSDVHEHLGEVYLAKGREYTQKAIAEWAKAIELKPSKTALKQKLDRLNAGQNSGSE
ncbi:MAG: tetratricopeptide repeat protein [Candidatus Poribacteria bacterium]